MMIKLTEHGGEKDYTPEELVHRAIALAKSRQPGLKPRWAVMRDIFGLGKSSSAALCRWVNLDPDEVIS